jgi:hypothetical protein
MQHSAYPRVAEGLLLTAVSLPVSYPKRTHDPLYSLSK